MPVTRKIAVLIDGDNAESKLIEHILDAAGKHGTTTIKRAYGDWSEPQLKSWREKLNAYAIRPIQKFAYTKGKNSTDSELIIDAMDILHSRLVDGFCIVSSDSDYTGLANRIREAGMFIMGIGRSKTPE
ncbi:MAG: NYN domain-containing protein, partial [Planctomycetaceae bacterium]|nr:NYN domain-containing protein [Planctomycetaceae bacterium]